MRTTVHLILATIALGSFAVQAQEKPAAKEPTITSSPGKVKGTATAKVTATVTAVDPATRTITLKGPKGNTVDIVASEEVRNFDQIKVGDKVVAQYREALSLELRKTEGKPSASEAGVVARAKPGERPAGVVAREVQVTAEVVAVDRAKNLISLKGPRGNVVDLKVKNPDHFKVVKKGDLVDAVYSEALAISVEPAGKAAAKK
jgi:hypothetical protein